MQSGRGVSRSHARSSVHSWAAQSPIELALHAGSHSYAMARDKGERYAGGNPNIDQQENRAAPRVCIRGRMTLDIALAVAACAPQKRRGSAARPACVAPQIEARHALARAKKTRPLQVALQPTRPTLDNCPHA